jgi:hypothetical protein
MRLKKDFLSDADVANIMIWTAKVKYYWFNQKPAFIFILSIVSADQQPACRKKRSPRRNRGRYQN